MKLLQYVDAGKVTLGIQTDRGVIPVAKEARKLGFSAPETMKELAEAGKVGLDTLRDIENAADTFEKDITFAPMVTGMDKIVCVGLNYRSHIGECNEKLPEYPVLFAKFPNALAPHNGKIELSPEFSWYDYEAELVIIIGKKAKCVPESEANEYILGYTCGNDLSNRQLQMQRGSQWITGKTCDGFGPTGPYVVTADSIEPDKLHIESRVNGEVRQSANTEIMIFPCKTLVSYISQHMTLMPGDMIFTGTPSGVMLGYPEDKKSWLKPGDVVEVEIEGIGTLKNIMA